MLKTALVRLGYMTVMFLAGIILSNLVLPERFGTISLLILNASLLSIITGLGGDSIVLHKVSNNKWETSEALQFTWRIITIQLALFFILEFGSLQIWGKTLLSNEKLAYLPIEAIYFVGLLFVEKYLSLLYSFHKALIANIALVVIGIIYLITLLITYHFVRTDFVAVLYLFSVQSFIQGLSLILLFQLSNKSEKKNKLRNKEFIGALKLSSVVMIANISQLIAYRVDFWVLKYFYNNYEVGIYAQANKFANLVWIVPNIMAQLLVPMFALMEKKVISKVFGVAMYFNLIILLVTVICANLFYSFFLNEQYVTGMSAFYLMLPGYFFWASVIFFGAYFSWAGKFSYNLICSLCCLVLIVIADFLLIPKYGLNGAAIANSIAYGLVFLIYFFILSRNFSIRWNEVLLLRRHNFIEVIKLLYK